MSYGYNESIMMLTSIEVKGHQRSNVVIYALWLPNLVRRMPNASFIVMTLMEVKGHQRSNVVYCAIVKTGSEDCMMQV